MSGVESEIVFEEGITFGFGKTITRTLPKAMAISEIIIQSTIGALSGGATGTYIANSAIESITVRIGGKETIVYNGIINHCYRTPLFEIFYFCDISKFSLLRT